MISFSKRPLDISIAVAGLLVCIVRGTGLLFFLSSAHWTGLLPIVVIIGLIVLPESVFRRLPIVLFLMIGSYVFFIFTNSMERILEVGVMVEDVVELGVVAYFSWRKFPFRKKESGSN